MRAIVPLGIAAAVALLLRLLHSAISAASDRPLTEVDHARLGFLLFGLVWVGSLCFLPVAVTMARTPRRAAGRFALWALGIVLTVPLGWTLATLFPFVRGGLCLVAGLAALCALGRLVSALSNRALAAGMAAGVLGLVLLGQVFWMNPFVDRLPGGTADAPGARERFLRVAMHAAPLGALGDAFGAQDVRPFERMNFSYRFSLLSKVRFEYPSWSTWCLVQGGAALVLGVAGELVFRVRKR
mgnify:CR=1 FL=1